MAQSGPIYKRVAEIVNPLLSPGCHMGADTIAFREDIMEVVPIAANLHGASFLLKDYRVGATEFLGVEVTGEIFDPRGEPIVRWFTFHEPDRRPVYHDTQEEAMRDPGAWIPPEYDWTCAGSKENPGHMDWDWWKSSVKQIVRAFNKEKVSQRHWNACPSRFIDEAPYTKNTIICLNEKTEQHLGFLQIQRDSEVVLQIPFVCIEDTTCFLGSVAEALSFPQDGITEFSAERAAYDALFKWTHVLRE